MTKKQKRIAIGFAIIFLAWIVFGYPPIYFAKEMRGQIVDAETGKPIEGTVIVAQWISYVVGIGHGGHNLRIHITETVTDKDGRYVIPGWGPKLRLPLTDLDHLDPRLSIFKSGYRPEELVNKRDRSSMVRSSDWNGKVIKLERFQGALEKHASLLSSLYIGLEREERDWKYYPRMLLALMHEIRKLESMGLSPKYGHSVPSIRNFSKPDQDWLKGFEK